jgi:drug/metabolite transporter (DMT)-like permease
MQFGASILAALGAAVTFAFAAVLQQESSQAAPEDKSLSVGLLADLIRRPRWLAGGACLLAGFGLQALALAYGPVALVQPIVATELAFAIPFGIFRRHRRAGRREWIGIGCIVAGVSLFLLIASPTKGIDEPSGVAWVTSLVPVGVVAAGALLVGRGCRGPRRAMFLGATAGLSFGVLSVLTKAITHLLSRDVAMAFVTWQVYAAVGVGIAALIVSQSAYQAGPLAYSMPMVGLLEPVVAVLIGDTVLGEQVHLSRAAVVLELIAAGVACVGITLLTTSQTALSIYEERHPHGDPAAVPGGVV